jgi:hypothetical protein
MSGGWTRRAIVRRSTIAFVIAAAGGLSLANNGAAGEYRRLPDGVDNPMPRYYDYRAPRAFYIDQAPVAFRLNGYPNQPYPNQPYGAGPIPPYPPAAVIYPPPVYAPPVNAPPMYAPAAAYAPPINAYAPPVQGYPVAPVVPNVVVVRPQPLCGVYRFWQGDRCVDARGY